MVLFYKVFGKCECCNKYAGYTLNITILHNKIQSENKLR